MHVAPPCDHTENYTAAEFSGDPTDNVLGDDYQHLILWI